jgi:large subunit ribosomal protein L21
MYAVIKTGGKQYRVTTGETLKVEILAGDVGSAIVLDKILMVSNGDTLSVVTHQYENLLKKANFKAGITR